MSIDEERVGESMASIVLDVKLARSPDEVFAYN